MNVPYKKVRLIKLSSFSEKFELSEAVYGLNLVILKWLFSVYCNQINCTYDKELSCKQTLLLQNIGSGNICQKILIVKADRDEDFLSQFLKSKQGM